MALAIAACGPGQKGGAPQARKAIPVEAVTVKPGAFTEIYHVAAIARPIQSFDISAEVGGTVLDLPVDVGQHVAQGEALLHLDAVPMTLLRDTRKAELERTRVRYAISQKALARARGLYGSGSVAESVLDDADLSARLAKADVRLADLALEKAERDLEFCAVRAPVDGEVTARFSDPGTILAPGAPLFHLARTGQIRLVAGISEQTVPYVKEGTEVAVRFDALPDKAFSGSVVHIGSADRENQAMFPVEVQLANPGQVIRPGMVARMEIPGRFWPNALVVPSSALQQGDEEMVLFAVEGGVARRLPVAAGRFTGDRVIISHGLQPGMKVVVVGQGALRGGEQVDVAVLDGAPQHAVAPRPAPGGTR